MKIILIYLLMFLNLPYALTLSTINLIKTPNKVNICIFSLLSSILLIYLPPLFDTIGTYNVFKSLMKVPLLKIMDIKQVDSLYYLPMLIGGRLNIDFYNIICVYYFIIIYMWLDIYRRLSKFIKNTKKSYKYFFLCVFILSIPYRNITDLNRYTLASIIYISGIIDYYYSDFKIKPVIKLVLAIFIHVGMILPISILIFSAITKKIKLNFYIYLIFSLTGILFLKKIGLVLLKINLSFIPIQKIKIYLIEANNLNNLLNLGFTGIIEVLQIILCFLIAYYILKKTSKFRSKKSERYHSFMKAFTFVTPIILCNYVLRERYLFVYILLSICYFYCEIIEIQNYKKLLKNFKKKAVLIILITLLLNIKYIKWTLASNYPPLKDHKETKKIVLKSLVYPPVLLLNINKFGYNNKWVDKNKVKSGKQFQYLSEIYKKK